MSRKTQFLGVEHEVIVEEEPPFFLGNELHLRVKVRNLEAKRVKRSFYYMFDYPGGLAWSMMQFDLEPNEEQVHPLYYNRTTHYLGFRGNFRIALFKGEQGRELNEKDTDKHQIRPYNASILFTGNVRDRDAYEIQIRQIRTSEAVYTMAKIGKITLFLTIVIAFLAAAEILLLGVG